MKITIITMILAFSLAFTFAGCGEKNMNNMGSDMQSTVDSAKDKVENGVNDITGNNSNNNNNNNNNATVISKDKAKSIAFNHANVNESDVYDIDIETEMDGGVSSYEISFETKSTEYDYRINSESGEIISSHKEDKKLDD